MNGCGVFYVVSQNFNNSSLWREQARDDWTYSCSLVSVREEAKFRYFYPMRVERSNLICNMAGSLMPWNNLGWF